MVRTHESTLRTQDDREPQRQGPSAIRRPANLKPREGNPGKNSRFRKIQVCDFRPPRCTGQMTFETAQMVVPGRCSRSHSWINETTGDSTGYQPLAQENLRNVA